MNRKQLRRLTRTILSVIIIWWAGIFIYAQKEVQTQDMQWQTKRVIEELKRDKQAVLDTLSYKETIQFYNDGTYSNSIDETSLKKLESIDNQITEQTEYLKTLPSPDYTVINQNNAPKTVPVTENNELSFIKLLK